MLYAIDDDDAGYDEDASHRPSAIGTSQRWTTSVELVALQTVTVRHSRRLGWRLGVAVSVVGRINEINQHRARLVHDG